MVFSYFQGPVRAIGINYHDLLGNPLQRGQTIVQIDLFIAGDEYD
jgi:hypothetical protein